MTHRPVAVLLAALTCTACASLEISDRAPEPAPEVQAQMQVKAALLEDSRVAAAPIRVEQRGNRLRLSGFVGTEAARRRAAEVAAQAVPDLEIINDLEVWRPPD